MKTILDFGDGKPVEICIRNGKLYEVTQNETKPNKLLDSRTFQG